MSRPARKTRRHHPTGRLDLPGKLTSRNASEARQQFFALLEEVSRDPTGIVLIDHKDLPEPAALVNAPFLLRTLRLLRSLTARQRAAAVPFRLIGSATLVGEPDGVLDEVRERQRALGRAKLAGL